MVGKIREQEVEEKVEEKAATASSLRYVLLGLLVALISVAAGESDSEFRKTEFSIPW